MNRCSSPFRPRINHLINKISQILTIVLFFLTNFQGFRLVNVFQKSRNKIIKFETEVILSFRALGIYLIITRSWKRKTWSDGIITTAPMRYDFKITESTRINHIFRSVSNLITIEARAPKKNNNNPRVFINSTCVYVSCKALMNNARNKEIGLIKINAPYIQMQLKIKISFHLCITI